jgi:hypothetical protein
MNSGKCWLMTTKCKSSDLRSGWRGGELSEEEEGDVSLGSSGEEDSDDEKEGDRPRKPGGHCQPGVQKVAARLHLQGAPWMGNVSRECRYEFFSQNLSCSL